MHEFLVTRRTALLAPLSVLVGCHRPSRGVSPEPRACPAQQPARITHKFLVDRTTAVPADILRHLCSYVEHLMVPDSRLQVLSFGGVSPNLIREECQIQLPSALPTQDQREADRWSKAPRDVQWARECLATAWAEVQVRSRIEAAIPVADTTPRGHSPIFEAVASACQGWADGTLVLWSNGIEHHGPGRSFYGAHGLAIPRPATWHARLRDDALLPELARRVSVHHLAIGLTEELGTARQIRQFPETSALKQLWRHYWDAAGARSLVFGEPLPVNF